MTLAEKKGGMRSRKVVSRKEVSFFNFFLFRVFVFLLYSALQLLINRKPSPAYKWALREETRRSLMISGKPDVSGFTRSRRKTLVSLRIKILNKCSSRFGSVSALAAHYRGAGWAFQDTTGRILGYEPKQSLILFWEHNGTSKPKFSWHAASVENLSKEAKDQARLQHSQGPVMGLLS